ncbi:Uncharacterised protein [Raoultella terrigena]|uniref:Uncharacterized protein n=1 Tax=Raoultella terrigena TaxID=577 RepID=A0A7Z8Z7H5_RAOTE|nr:Uncharacterised protein [Raoultella terrigena]
MNDAPPVITNSALLNPRAAKKPASTAHPDRFCCQRIISHLTAAVRLKDGPLRALISR